MNRWFSFSQEMHRLRVSFVRAEVKMLFTPTRTLENLIRFHLVRDLELAAVNNAAHKMRAGMSRRLVLWLEATPPMAPEVDEGARISTTEGNALSAKPAISTVRNK